MQRIHEEPSSAQDQELWGMEVRLREALLLSLHPLSVADLQNDPEDVPVPDMGNRGQSC